MRVQPYLSIALAVLLVGGVAGGNGPSRATAAAAPPLAGAHHAAPGAAAAVITVSPAAIKGEGRVLVSGTGFAAGEAVQIHVQEAPAVAAATRATAGGLVGATPLTIPATFRAGPYIVVATGLASKRVARAIVTVVAPAPTATTPPRPLPTIVARPSPAAVVKAAIALSPASVERGGVVTVSGAGFAANEAVLIYFNAAATVVTTARANAAGLLPATLARVPATLTAGAHHVTAIGATSKRSAVGLVTIVVPAATAIPTATRTPAPAAPTATPKPAPTAAVRAAIAVAPAVARRGGVVTISGGNFAANETVLIYFNAIPRLVTTAHATAAGLLPATNLTVPAALTAGAHHITALGVTSKRSAVTTVTVVVPAPVPVPMVKAAIAVVPGLVNRGGLVTVSGAGFRAGEVVAIYFNRAPKQVTTARATAAGLVPATGVTVPYALPVGAEPLTAVGTISKRVARGVVTVQALTPSLTLSPATARPGTIVTVTGRGFGASERVTLALNGAALVTTPAVVATADGAFTASFRAPGSLVDGPNTVGAIGNLSRIAAVAALNGVLPVSAQFYFAGAMNTATEHSSINLLNANGQATTVQLTFYFDNGTTGTKTVSVAPTSVLAVPVAGFGFPAGTFGLYVTANRHITAEIVTTRDGRDGDVLLGNTGLGTRWYLAEGYTGLSFRETVSVLNPDPATPAHVQLQLLPFGGRRGKTIIVTVAPHSNLATDINGQLPGQSLSVIAVSNRPVVVERTLTFSNGGYGLTTRAGTNTPATNWLFAEGTTVNRFQTYLTILNPSTIPARVTASFFGQAGGSLGSKTVVVAGLSRANLKLNDFLSASGIASVLTSDLPVVVERPEYFGSPNDASVAGSDVFGLNGAGVRWSFPGGDTGGSSEFLLVYNPSPLPVDIDVDLYGSNGQRLVKRVSVPPAVRYNINVNTLAPGFEPIHGAILRSASGQGFIAEQTVFTPNYSNLRSTQGLAQ